jgi:nucleotide-binding universal stress UspA family protein
LEHFRDYEIKHAKQHLETVCDKELKACPNLQTRLVQGDAATEILKMIKAEKADLVVLTTHGRGAEELDQKSPEFGSVARKVMANSPVPVHLINPLNM